MDVQGRMFATRRRHTPKLEKCLSAGVALEAGLYLLAQSGRLPLNKGMPVILAATIAGMLLTLVLASFLGGFLLSWRFQFTSRSLLAMVLVAAIPCGWLAAAIAYSERQRRSVDLLKMRGCRVEHAPNVDGDTPWGVARTSASPVIAFPRTLLVQLLGADFFADVVYVDNTPIGGSVIRVFRDVDMGSLQGLGHLRYLTLDFSSDLIAATGSDHDVGDAGMTNLSGLVEMRQLSLSNSRKIGDGALGSLKAMSKLRRLSLYDVPRISDTGLVNFRGLRELRALAIVDASIGGAGLEGCNRRSDWLSWRCGESG